MIRSFLSPEPCAMFFCGFCPPAEWWHGKNWGRNRGLKRKAWWSGELETAPEVIPPRVIPPRPPFQPMPGMPPKPKARPSGSSGGGRSGDPPKKPHPPKGPPPKRKAAKEVVEVEDEKGRAPPRKRPRTQILIYSGGLQQTADRFQQKLGPSFNIF